MYYHDLAIAWFIRGFLLASIFALFAVMAGCSGTSDRTRSLDLGVKGLYVPGPEAPTRNQNPQGGTDEKSDSTPGQPSG